MADGLGFGDSFTAGSGCGDFRSGFCSAGTAAGKSALMGRFPGKAGTVQAGRWLAGQLVFGELVD
jgi:hypothetical protein